MNQPIVGDQVSPSGGEGLLAEFRELWRVADDLWTEGEADAAFRAYVSADYEEVYRWLVRLRGTTTSFLEWGSGLGVVTMMASRLGFDAWGIEAEEELVQHSWDLASRFAPNAQFAQGSFVPDEFEWNPAAGDESINTSLDLADAYDQLGMELLDFELVYAYPWPTEHPLLHHILKEFGCDNVALLTYDAREGAALTYVNRHR